MGREKAILWDWGAEQQGALVKAKIWTKLMKGLELSKMGLPLGLEVSVIPEVGIIVKNSKRRECPWKFGPNCRKGHRSDTLQ